MKKQLVLSAILVAAYSMNISATRNGGGGNGGGNGGGSTIITSAAQLMNTSGVNQGAVAQAIVDAVGSMASATDKAGTSYAAAQALILGNSYTIPNSGSTLG